MDAGFFLARRINILSRSSDVLGERLLGCFVSSCKPEHDRRRVPVYFSKAVISNPASLPHWYSSSWHESKSTISWAHWSSRCWSSVSEGLKRASRRGRASFALSGSLVPCPSDMAVSPWPGGLPEPWYSLSHRWQRSTLASLRWRCPRQTLCRFLAAASSSRSRWRFSRSAWACATDLDAPEGAGPAGPHVEFAQGFVLRWPLRLTFRGRLEFPVNVVNMVAVSRGESSLVRGCRERCR
jgi:hypothetical protein